MCLSDLIKSKQVLCFDILRSKKTHDLSNDNSHESLNGVPALFLVFIQWPERKISKNAQRLCSHTWGEGCRLSSFPPWPPGFFSSWPSPPPFHREGRKEKEEGFSSPPAAPEGKVSVKDNTARWHKGYGYNKKLPHDGDILGFSKNTEYINELRDWIGFRNN